MSGEPSEPLSRAEAAAIAIALRERVAEARGVLLWGEQALRVAATLDAARPAPLDVDEPTDAQIVAAWNEASKADWYATDSWTEHVARGRAFLAALRATPLAGAASDEEGGA